MHGVGFGPPLQVDKDHFSVATELPQELAAGAARWREARRVGSDRDAAESALAFRYGLEEGDALRAHGESIARVLDVAAGIDCAGTAFESRSNLEL